MVTLGSGNIDLSTWGGNVGRGRQFSSPDRRPGGRKKTDGEKELAALAERKTRELRREWHETYCSPPPPGMSRNLLIRAAAYRIQADRHGGLDPPTERMLRSLIKDLAAEGALSLSSRGPIKPGAQSHSI